MVTVRIPEVVKRTLVRPVVRRNEIRVGIAIVATAKCSGMEL